MPELPVAPVVSEMPERPELPEKSLRVEDEPIEEVVKLLTSPTTEHHAQEVDGSTNT